MTIDERPHWRVECGIALQLLLVALLPRILLLGADPPASVPAPFLADEGWWAHNARQFVLFGTWMSDQHNPGLFVTPLYTVLLAGLYQLAGVSLATTRLLSALAGALTVPLFYLGLRAAWPRRRALLAAMLVAFSYVMLTTNRQGYTESVQLCLIVAGVAGLLGGRRHPAWAGAGAVALVLSLLAKPSSAVMGLVVIAWWAFRWRRTAAGSDARAGLRREILVAVGAGLLAGIAILGVLVLPNLLLIREQLGISLAHAYEGNERLLDGGVLVLGLRWLSVRPVNLWTDGLVPVLVALSLLWRRARSPAPVDPAELLLWLWFGLGLLNIAVLANQPDRRYLFLVPPVAGLAALALTEAWREPGGTARARAGAGLVIGWALGIVAVAWLAERILRRMPAVAETTVSSALWHATIVLAVLAALFLPRLLDRVGRVPAGLWLLLFVVSEPVRFARDLAGHTSTIRDAARAIGAAADRLPEAGRVMEGAVAGTLALESDLRAFWVRDEAGIGARVNLDGWDRLRPGLAVRITPGPRPVEATVGPGLTPRCRYLLWPGRGRPARFYLHLYARPGLELSCEAGSVGGTDRPADQP